MNDFLKLHKTIPLKVNIPNVNREQLIVWIDNIIEETSEKRYVDLHIYLKPENIEKFPYLTPKIIHYYVKLHLSDHLKLFSIHKEFDIHFI